MLKSIYQATLSTNKSGLMLKSNGETRQLPREVDLPLAMAITRLEAALAYANAKKQNP